MIPKMMAVKHSPPDSYGDCLRACIASIIECEPTAIPHPGARGEDHWQDEIKKMDSWLAERGYWTFGIMLRNEDLALYQDFASGYYILGGRSPRAPHFVVAKGREIVHDPHPDGGGLVADPDGTWNMMFVCYGGHPQGGT